ncbi:MAG: hypothetical protein RLZZ34_216, partial [Verrucomicrobiota bacterium]
MKSAIFLSLLCLGLSAAAPGSPSVPLPSGP